MFSLIDSHIHLDAPELAGTGTDLLPPARLSGIDKFIIPGVRVSGWRGMLALAQQQPGVFAAPGLHPVFAEQWSAAAERQLRELSSEPQVVAIGEIGLDAVAGPPLAEQEQVLREQLQIALDAGLPVLLHNRKATGRLLDILRELDIGRQLGGIWHGFSGSLSLAQQLVQLGFKIGVGPILLCETARKLPQAVVELPAAALVLETDLPDMAEQPETLVAVAQKVAELRGWSLEETARITTENARQVFGF
ncbi:MAG: TatD family hydrolase [Deltaproteobacteria bacterium]|nr:TatD family hydrolase [Deltaproteobacteria bacterium]